MILFFLGCSFSTEELYFEKATNAEKEEKYDLALNYFLKTIEVKPESNLALQAAQRGAFVARSFTEDYGALLKFLRAILLRSNEIDTRIGAQAEIGDIYFEKLANYPKAIEEYSRLLTVKMSSPQKLDFRLKIAKAYYFMGQFKQSEFEINELEKIGIPETKKFEVELMKGNIYTGLKKFDSAIKVFQNLISNFPEKSKEEKVRMNMVVCFEEKKEFDSAISTLQKVALENPDEKDFIDLKIERLRHIKGLQPGAKGFKK